MEQVKVDFEAWCKGKLSLTKSGGEYSSGETQLAWVAWLAGRQSAPAAPAAPVQVLPVIELPNVELTDMQGESFHGYMSAIEAIKEKLEDAGIKYIEAGI